MTPEDMAFVQTSLGLSTVVDLRNSDEAAGAGRWPQEAEAGRREQNGPSVSYHNIPFLEDRDISHPVEGVDPVVRLTEIYTLDCRQRRA